MHTPALDASAVVYDDLGARTRAAADEAGALAEMKPLQNGESDSTWDKFGPSYKQAGEAIAGVLEQFCGVIGGVGDGLRGQSKAYGDTEQGNEDLAGSLGVNKGAQQDPSSTAGEGPALAVKGAVKPNERLLRRLAPAQEATESGPSEKTSTGDTGDTGDTGGTATGPANPSSDVEKKTSDSGEQGDEKPPGTAAMAPTVVMTKVVGVLVDQDGTPIKTEATLFDPEGNQVESDRVLLDDEGNPTEITKWLGYQEGGGPREITRMGIDSEGKQTSGTTWRLDEEGEVAEMDQLAVGKDGGVDARSFVADETGKMVDTEADRLAQLGLGRGMVIEAPPAAPHHELAVSTPEGDSAAQTPDKPVLVAEPRFLPRHVGVEPVVAPEGTD
ncbi:MAG: hypothetical protein ACRCZD_13560, partial [Phycicoccus sp.]